MSGETYVQMECPKDFQCYKDRFENMPKMRLAAGVELVECLDEGVKKCGFSMPFGYSHFCECPLRGYVAREFQV